MDSAHKPEHEHELFDGYLHLPARTSSYVRASGPKTSSPTSNIVIVIPFSL